MKAAIIFGILFGAGLASAQAQPYVGLDANRISLTPKSSDSELFPQSAGGEDLHIGDRFGNFAGELGFGSSVLAGSGNVDNLHLTKLTLDGLVYLPVFEGLSFLVTAGGAETNYGVSVYQRSSYTVGVVTKTTNTDMTVLHGDEFDWRGGMGFSFGLDEFELRVLGRYQPLSMGGQAQNAFGVEIGVNVYL